VVIASDQGLRVTGGFALRPRHEKLFFVDSLCPDQWNIEEEKAADLRPVPFGRFAPDQGTGTRIRALLPEGTSTSVTNVKVTDRSIEEAILIEADIETGTTDRRIITLENAGRDELVTSQTVGVERSQ